MRVAVSDVMGSSDLFTTYHPYDLSGCLRHHLVLMELSSEIAWRRLATHVAESYTCGNLLLGTQQKEGRAQLSRQSAVGSRLSVMRVGPAVSLGYSSNCMRWELLARVYWATV